MTHLVDHPNRFAADVVQQGVWASAHSVAAVRRRR